MTKRIMTGDFRFSDGGVFEYILTISGANPLRVISVEGLCIAVEFDMRRVMNERLSLLAYICHLVEESIGGGAFIKNCTVITYDKFGHPKKTREHEFNETPSIYRMTMNWAAALYRWNDSGRPVRGNTEVIKILDICKACSHYRGDVDKGKCGLCGCSLSLGLTAATNKAKMATENCPIGKW